ncbi:MAG: RNA polymerase sigma-70 factor (ECF subfamily) [Candidatus Latescibacterota bacterium]|jgi:RNA polymerase sigma-70 factor (ECF subfamily)
MAPNEEQTTVLQARAGNGAAFEKLYEKNVARIYAVVANRTKNQDDVEDLVQIAFIRAYEGLDRFRGDAAFSTWLTRIAMNVCVSHYESQNVRQKYKGWLHSPEGMAHVGPTWAEDPEHIFYAQECRTQVRRGIRRLPKPYQEAMQLRYLEDKSYSEIERQMQVPMGTIKTWLYRGRELLLEYLEDQEINMYES